MNPKTKKTKIKPIEKFYKTWWFLMDEYEWAINHLDIDVVKVNPKTRRVDDNETKNTKIEYWIECGLPGEHDIKLDCGGDSFEEAVINLSRLLKRYYKPDMSYEEIYKEKPKF